MLAVQPSVRVCCHVWAGFLMPSPVSCCDASRAKSAREASQGKNSTNISINHYTLPGERRSERTVFVTAAGGNYGCL